MMKQFAWYTFQLFVICTVAYYLEEHGLREFGAAAWGGMLSALLLTALINWVGKLIKRPHDGHHIAGRE